jgi:hypothetical protein
MLSALAKVDLLILDDWGPSVLDDDQRRDLLEIAEDRYERRSTIITSQVPIDRWYEIIGNPTIADAVRGQPSTKHRAHWPITDYQVWSRNSEAPRMGTSSPQK